MDFFFFFSTKYYSGVASRLSRTVTEPSKDMSLQLSAPISQDEIYLFSLKGVSREKIIVRIQVKSIFLYSYCLQFFTPI